MEHASFLIAKRHRPQVLARLHALGLTYKEERARGGTECIVLGSREQLQVVQASLEEYWRQIDELERAMSADSPAKERLSQNVVLRYWRAANAVVKGSVALAFVAIVAVAVYLIGSPWSAEGKAIKSMQQWDLSYTDFANLSYETLARDMRTVCQNLDSKGWNASSISMWNAVEKDYFDDDADPFHVMHANMALHDSVVIMHYAVIVDCPSFKSQLSSPDPYINTDSWSSDYPGFSNN